MAIYVIVGIVALFLGTWLARIRID
jgi:hypothetical protein